MSPLQWGLKHLLFFWLAGVAFSTSLLVVAAFTMPREVVWLIPYPANLQIVWHILRNAFVARPLEATALIAVPFVLATVTLVWLIARLARRAS